MGSIAPSPLRFALTFGAIAGVLFAVYTFPYERVGISEKFFESYLALYAQLAGKTLSLFDPHVTVHQQDILGRYNLRIVKNCDAMEANILYAAAVLAFPVAVRARLVGLASGVALLVAINIVRICSLYYVGILAPQAFPFFHLELWPLLLIASGAALFLFWATLASRRERETPAHAAAQA
jgi:exosortase/archaeosortase family protein